MGNLILIHNIGQNYSLLRSVWAGLWASYQPIPRPGKRHPANTLHRCWRVLARAPAAPAARGPCQAAAATRRREKGGARAGDRSEARAHAARWPERSLARCRAPSGAPYTSPEAFYQVPNIAIKSYFPNG